MDTAKLFCWGRSQTRRLPKDYRFQGDELAVKHFSSGVLLLPLDDPWATLEAGLASFEPGFVLERQQPDDPQQARAWVINAASGSFDLAGWLHPGR